MNNNFGIYDKSYTLIIDSFAKFPEIEKAYIFGSRAMGNYEKGSDIDIAIEGASVNFNTVSLLNGLLNEHLPIPYFVDVVNINTIDLEALKQPIFTEGVLVYQKNI